MTNLAGKTIRIEQAWPPRQLSPNSRCHHMEQYRFKRAAKDTAYWLTKAALGHDKFEHDGGTIAVRIVGHPVKGKVSPDADNLMASCKAILDGFALGLGVDDKHFRPTVEIGEPVPNGKLVIEVLA